MKFRFFSSRRPTMGIPCAGDEDLSYIGLPANQWKIPLSLALAVHLMTFAFTMLPSLFNLRPRLPEVYTVELFNASEITPPAPAVAQPSVAITPRKTKTIKQPSPPAAAKPVSLNPRKPKPQHVPVKDKPLQKERLSEVATIRDKAREQEAQRAAQEAVQAAISSLRAAIHESAPRRVTPRLPGAAVGLPGDDHFIDKVRKQYYAAIILQINEHWSLPDLQHWPGTLEAVLVIRVRRDGIVGNVHFEKKSNNIYFNQFALKAVQESVPLPPFPAQLQEREMEIGLRFRPGDLM